MLHEREHVEAQLDVLLRVYVHRNNLKNLFPVVDDCSLSSTHKKIKDEALRCATRPVVIIFLHFLDERFKFNREKVAGLFKATVLGEQLKGAVYEVALATEQRA